MHPSTLILMIMVAAATAAEVVGNPADGTPAARFWEAAIPGTPMPGPLAELVQKGIDDSPLAKNFSGPYLSIRMCLGHIYVSVCSVDRVKAAGTGLFFNEDQVRVGATMTISFAAAGVPAVLPHAAAEKLLVPFGNNNLTVDDIISRFNIAPGSEMASQVGDTLRLCHQLVAPSHAGGGEEKKSCAASVEDMVREATRTLGLAGGEEAWVAASEVPGAGLPLQEYAVEAVTPLAGDDHVACHDEPFPYAVFRCHKIGVSATKAYAISLRGLRISGPAAGVTMAVICHLDTSGWNPAYPAFEMMGTKPGESSVCHFMPYANLLFGKKTANEMESF
ncbi:hypothetical protein QOZ80_5BG0445480 [Eleusine coracana subsp. coracana]|nr:hypothetical protein QOZ80_5BG0445480 [Eleusine coracana subsp. coracana]